MSKKIKTLIISLGVLVLLGGGYYLSTIYQKKKEEAARPVYNRDAAPRIGNLETSKLVKMEVSNIVLEKIGDTWILTSLDGMDPPGGIELEQSPIVSMTYSLASVWTDRILDEEPEDLDVYGLNDNAIRTVVTDSDGKRVVYLLGDITPSRTSFYAMEEGDPKVYIISYYTAENMTIDLDKLRKKFLFPDFEVFDITVIRLDTAGTRVEIKPKPDPLPAHLSSGFISHVITSPYKIPRGVDGENFNNFVTPLKELNIRDFIDDAPSSLVPYGLDKPVRVFLELQNAYTLDLLIGSPVDGNHYAKLADAPGVFTLAGMDAIVNARPYSLTDKFALLVNIDKVEHLAVYGGEQPITVAFQGKGDDGVYTVNGKKAETKSFKTFYQAVIGLLSDAEMPGGGIAAPEARRGILDLLSSQSNLEAGHIRIEYLLDDPAGVWVSITLVPYDRDFYALQQEGYREFLISRNQVRRIYETFDALIYE